MRASGSLASQVGGCAAALVISFCGSPAVLLAQTSEADSAFRPPDDSALQFLARSLPEGRNARVLTRTGTRTLAVLRFTADGVAMAPSAPGASTDGQPALLPWRDIERIDVRVGSAGRGALIGGVTAGLLVGALAVAVASDPFLGRGAGGDAGPALAVTALGALAGAGVGALIGTYIPHWHRVYPRTDRDADERAKSWSSRGAQRH
jgi:hypothetical protein